MRARHTGMIGHAERLKRYYYRQKEKGLCVHCSEKAKKGYVLCNKHLEQERLSQERLRRKHE